MGSHAFPPCHRVSLKSSSGGCLNWMRDLGNALRQPLARANVERHARPAPVLNLQPKRSVGLGLRARMHTVFLAIADDRLAVDDARAILSANGVGGMDRLNRLPHLHFFGTHRSRLQTRPAAPSRRSSAAPSHGSAPRRAERRPSHRTARGLRCRCDSAAVISTWSM